MAARINKFSQDPYQALLSWNVATHDSRRNTAEIMAATTAAATATSSLPVTGILLAEIRTPMQTRRQNSSIDALSSISTAASAGLQSVATASIKAADMCKVAMEMKTKSNALPIMINAPMVELTDCSTASPASPGVPSPQKGENGDIDSTSNKPDSLQLFDAFAFSQPAQSARPFLKRPRPLTDVDGPNTASLYCKKRRLRRYLITSRLSQPFSLPATHILNRESSAAGDKRFLKLAAAANTRRIVQLPQPPSFSSFPIVPIAHRMVPVPHPLSPGELLRRAAMGNCLRQRLHAEGIARSATAMGGGGEGEARSPTLLPLTFTSMTSPLIGSASQPTAAAVAVEILPSSTTTGLISGVSSSIVPSPLQSLSIPPPPLLPISLIAGAGKTPSLSSTSSEPLRLGCRIAVLVQNPTTVAATVNSGHDDMATIVAALEAHHHNHRRVESTAQNDLRAFSPGINGNEDDADDMDYAFPMYDHQIRYESGDEPDDVYSDFSILFGPSSEDGSYVEEGFDGYMDELDGIAHLPRGMYDKIIIKASLMASISVRESMTWAGEAPGEPTSTIVLTSPQRRFVDVRILHSNLNGSEKASPIAAFPLVWAFAGTSSSSLLLPEDAEVETDGNDNGNGTVVVPQSRAIWRHWVDSNFEQAESVIDRGICVDLTAELSLESGEMVNPATGVMTSYEERWRSVRPMATTMEGVGAGIVKCLVMQLDDDDNGRRGIVQRLGQYCQGILRTSATDVTVERWAWTATDGWRCIWRMGNGSLPCAAVVKEEVVDLIDGTVVRDGDLIWTVVEAVDI